MCLRHAVSYALFRSKKTATTCFRSRNASRMVVSRETMRSTVDHPWRKPHCSLERRLFFSRNQIILRFSIRLNTLERQLTSDMEEVNRSATSRGSVTTSPPDLSPKIGKGWGLPHTDLNLLHISALGVVRDTVVTKFCHEILREFLKSRRVFALWNR
ncbi:hypothetical protein J6590_060216 [Homalodisca vitripennis]|nr:hypothetical protein J6590_060216 [Homalodisca vitripennis]